MKDITKRNITFRNTDSPLMSERVRIILSHPEDSKKLADAVRNLRNGNEVTFTLSEETIERLNTLTKL